MQSSTLKQIGASGPIEVEKVLLDPQFLLVNLESLPIYLVGRESCVRCRNESTCSLFKFSKIHSTCALTYTTAHSHTSAPRNCKIYLIDVLKKYTRLLNMTHMKLAVCTLISRLCVHICCTFWFDDTQKRTIALSCFCTGLYINMNVPTRLQNLSACITGC